MKHTNLYEAKEIELNFKYINNKVTDVMLPNLKNINSILKK